MPNPAKYKNTKRDYKRYMADYMSTAKSEGMERDQAVAVALTRWRKEHGSRHPGKKPKEAAADEIRKFARTILARTGYYLVDPSGESETWLQAKIKLSLDPKTGRHGQKALVLFGTDPKEDRFDHKAEIPADLLRLPEHLVNFEKHTEIASTDGADSSIVGEALGEDYSGKKAGELVAKVKTALADPEYAPVKGTLLKMEKAFSENPGMIVRSY